MTTRNVPVPRVKIPSRTVDVKDSALLVSGIMEEDTNFNPTSPASNQWATIWGKLQTGGNSMGVKLASALEKEGQARALRAELATLSAEAKAELRNARDLILAFHPENPMEITNFGFEAFTSPASQGGGTEEEGTGTGTSENGTEGGDPAFSPA